MFRNGTSISTLFYHLFSHQNYSYFPSFSNNSNWKKQNVLHMSFLRKLGERPVIVVTRKGHLFGFIVNLILIAFSFPDCLWHFHGQLIFKPKRKIRRNGQRVQHNESLIVEQKYSMQSSKSNLVSLKIKCNTNKQPALLRLLVFSRSHRIPIRNATLFPNSETVLIRIQSKILFVLLGNVDCCY